MKNQNPININVTRKNKKSKTSTKSMQKPARARDNRWNKNNEHAQDDFERYQDYDNHNVDTYRKVWSDCNAVYNKKGLLLV